MNGFLVLLLVVFLWCLFFLYLYTRQVKAAGRHATRYLLRQALAGEKMRLHREEEISRNAMLLSLAVKMGGLFFTGLVLRFFLAPDLFLGLLLAAVITGGVFWVRRSPAGPPVQAGWETIHSLPEGYGIFAVTLSRPGREEKWIGATLSELDLRKKDLLVLAILKDERLVVFPKGPEILSTGDRLVIFGKKKQSGGFNGKC